MIFSHTSHRWYFILVDETQDLSSRKQMVICLKWESDEYEIFEDLIGFVQLDNITSDTLYSVLKDSIVHLGLDFGDCRGQDMMGSKFSYTCQRCGQKIILLLSQNIV